MAGFTPETLFKENANGTKQVLATTSETLASNELPTLNRPFVTYQHHVGLVR